MYLKLIRNVPQGSAITGRLVIDGRYFCNTLERVGYQIPALCYPVRVTHSPKFKRLLPIVQNVPRLAPALTSDSANEYRDSDTRSGGNLLRSTQSECSEQDKINKISAPTGQGDFRTGIRFHRGTKPEHSTGCILVVADNPCRARELIGAGVVEKNVVEVVDSNNPVVGCRSAADVESQLTQLLLQAQNDHEEIILEVTDFHPGTEYGYNTPCPSSECAREKEIRSANFARRHSYLAGARTIVSSSILEPTRLSDGY